LPASDSIDKETTYFELSVSGVMTLVNQQACHRVYFVLWELGNSVNSHPLSILCQFSCHSGAIISVKQVFLFNLLELIGLLSVDIC